MKKIAGILMLTGMVFSMLAIKTADDFLGLLGITDDEAHEYVWNSFQYRSFSYPYSATYKSLNSQARIALVKEIGAFAKAYSKTDHFRNKYLEYRETQKPKKPDPPQSMDDMRAQYKTDIQKSIDEMESQLTELTGDSKTYLETALKSMKDQLKQLDDPNNPMFSNEIDAQQQQYYEGQLIEYQKILGEWEEKYPDSPASMIRERLEHFIELSGQVDFNAKLTKNEYEQMVFINNTYEHKPPDWKMLYRAGKESVDAAKEVAQKWLTEL